jgi:hypothetical protein
MNNNITLQIPLPIVVITLRSDFLREICFQKISFIKIVRMEWELVHVSPAGVLAVCTWDVFLLNREIYGL